MKSKLIKIITVLLMVIICFSFVACNDQGDKDNGGDKLVDNTVAKNPTSLTDEHLVEGTLHKVNVTFGTRKLVEKGVSEYTFILGNGINDGKAVGYINQHIRACSGATIDVERYSEELEYSADSKYIVFDCPELFQKAGLTMPEDDLGQTGYYIKSLGESVFIAIGSDFAAQQAGLAFLRYVIGYEMYSDDTVVYENKAEILPDMDVIEKPDFEFYYQSNSVTAEASYGMGITPNLFIGVNGENWHNSLNYLPMDTYQSSHPLWYSTYNNELCYTAHGDEKELEAMVDEVAKQIVNLALNNNSCPFISLTIEDHNTVCSCDSCEQIRANYNGANSAAVIKFLNRVNRKVQASLQAHADEAGTAKRELKILFFAYNKMESAPAKKVNGVYEPIDESVICDPELGVYFAPITATYNKSFYEPENSAVFETISAWGACTNRLYLWLYETDYTTYLYPFNTFDSMIETYRYCKSKNGVFMFPEGQWNQTNTTGFGKLKEYFNSRALFNVNESVSDIYDDFFTNYFKDAAKPMRQFFDELQAHLKYIEQEYPEVNGNIYNNMDLSKYWSFATLNHWMDLIDEAYDSIEHYRDTQPVLYESLEKHIKLESIFPRFALCRLYGGMYSEEDIDQMRRDFRTDCQSLSITMYGETKSLDTIFTIWGM